MALGRDGCGQGSEKSKQLRLDSRFKGIEFHAEHVALFPTDVGTGDVQRDRCVYSVDSKGKLLAGMNAMGTSYLQAFFGNIEQIAPSQKTLNGVLDGHRAGRLDADFPFTAF